MSTLLPSLTPLQQLRAGRLPRRLVQLYAGLALYGFSMALVIEAGLGLDPWDVLHQGLGEQLGWSFGTVTVVVGALVLLLWVPLRQWPGLGTVSNVVVIGLAVDAALVVLPPVESLPVRIALLVGGVLANALAGAPYLGSVLGAGPRDGLMTGLVTRTGHSVRLVRTCLELTVLGIGVLLGGTVGTARCSTRWRSARWCSSSCRWSPSGCRRPSAGCRRRSSPEARDSAAHQLDHGVGHRPGVRCPAEVLRPGLR